MDLPDPRRRLTPAEYLSLEAMSTERLEYRDGHAVALAVPSKNHARISGNLVMALGPSVRANGCDFFAGDARVAAPNGDRLIPDFLVTCDPRDGGNAVDGEAVVLHPWLVIEILSPSTAADDTTDKLDAYQTIEELTHYVVIDSRRRVMRVYERVSEGRFTTPAPVKRLILPTLGEHGISMDEVYRETTVPLRSDLVSPDRPFP